MNKTIKLFINEKLKETNHTKYWLHKETGIASSSIDKYCSNKIQRYDNSILLRICIALNCEPGDIIKIVSLK